jgi:hypothetical protein
MRRVIPEHPTVPVNPADTAVSASTLFRDPGPESGMLPDRAALDVEDLLKLILVLVVIYIAVNILFEFVEFIVAPFGALSNVIGLIIVVLIIAWFLDYI